MVLYHVILRSYSIAQECNNLVAPLPVSCLRFDQLKNIVGLVVVLGRGTRKVFVKANNHLLTLTIEKYDCARGTQYK